MGGLGGAAYGAVRAGVDPGSLARMRQGEELQREQQKYADLYQQQKAQTGLQGDVLSNEVKAAQIPYLLARPDLEKAKIDNKAEYDSWRMKSGDRKADSAESYITWRMANGDRRALTAEGQLELRREWQREIQPAQFDRRMDETERHNVVNEALGGERIRQGDERNDIAREGLTLRERLGTGNLDASWARIGQTYDRMDADRQKQVDVLAAKAAQANAEADYFEKSGKTAEAKLKRDQALTLRGQAEGIASRPAPRVARPTAPTRTPPVSEEDFVAHARQQLGAAFNEAQARAAYRQRYGR